MRSRHLRLQHRSRVIIHTERGGNTMGPCSYCGNRYKQAFANVHFIPCCYCNSLEHAGCQH